MHWIKLTALTLGVWIVLIPQISGQPSQRIAPKKQAPDSHLAQKPSNGEQGSDTAELKAIADAITKYEQETANSQNQETPYEKESIKVQWFVFWVGIAQTIALILTLLAIVYQSMKTAAATEATKVSSEATRNSVELQKAGMRQWIVADAWEAGPIRVILDTNAELRVTFQIVNPTKYPLRLHQLLVWIDRSHVLTILFGRIQLSPDERYPITVQAPLEETKLKRYRSGKMPLKSGDCSLLLTCSTRLRQRDSGAFASADLPILAILLSAGSLHWMKRN